MKAHTQKDTKNLSSLFTLWFDETAALLTSADLLLTFNPQYMNSPQEFLFIGEKAFFPVI